MLLSGSSKRDRNNYDFILFRIVYLFNEKSDKFDLV